MVKVALFLGVWGLLAGVAGCGGSGGSDLDADARRADARDAADARDTADAQDAGAGADRAIDVTEAGDTAEATSGDGSDAPAADVRVDGGGELANDGRPSDADGEGGSDASDGSTAAADVADAFGAAADASDGGDAACPVSSCARPAGLYCSTDPALTMCRSCLDLRSDPVNVCQCLVGIARANCEDLFNCMSPGFFSCAVSDPKYPPPGQLCFCSDFSCSQGANGRCAAQFQAVAGSTDTAEVMRQLRDPTTLVARVAAAASRYSVTQACAKYCPY